jgi:hypothetical protein
VGGDHRCRAWAVVRSGVSQRTLFRAVIDYRCPVPLPRRRDSCAVVIFAVAVAESVTEGQVVAAAVPATNSGVMESRLIRMVTVL